MSSGQLSFIHHFQPAQNQVDKKTLFLLHGTGGDENQMVPIGHTLAPGAAILSPRGKVLENGNARHFRRLAEGVFDEEDLIFRTHELADFIQQACQSYKLDCNHIIAVGYSNGANIAAALLLLRPNVLSGAVLFKPMVPLIPREQPNLKGKHIFIAAGESDPIVPIEETRRLAKIFSRGRSGGNSTLGQAGHNITNTDIQTARGWMECVD